MSSYDYYPAVLYAIDQISQGHTLTSACDLANIAVVTFDKYCKGDAELRALYEEAVQRGNDAMADALINIDNHKIHGQQNPQMAKVVSDNIKWVLGRRDPKRFGDKIEIKHEITLDRAIIAQLERARTRTTPALPAPTDVVDVEYEVVDDDAIMAELLR